MITNNELFKKVYEFKVCKQRIALLQADLLRIRRKKNVELSPYALSSVNFYPLPINFQPRLHRFNAGNKSVNPATVSELKKQIKGLQSQCKTLRRNIKKSQSFKNTFFPALGVFLGGIIVLKIICAFSPLSALLFICALSIMNFSAYKYRSNLLHNNTLLRPTETTANGFNDNQAPYISERRGFKD